MKPQGLVPNYYIHVSVSDLYIPNNRSSADQSWEYLNRSQIFECGNFETEHYNSVLKKKYPGRRAVSFLGIHKLETDIYTGFSLAPHLVLECNLFNSTTFM